MASETGPLLAGQLARLAGVSTDTLRHYERKGLIPPAPRRANGYRAYPREALDRVRVATTPHGGRALLLESLTHRASPHTTATAVGKAVRRKIINTRKGGHQ